MDKLIKRANNNKLEIAVYQKPSSTDIYINWNAHVPTEWKIRTLRNLIKGAKRICSDESLVNEKMKYLTKVFHEVNNYPMSIINKIGQQELNDSQSKNRRAETNFSIIWKARKEINNKDEKTYQKNFTRKHADGSGILKKSCPQSLM